MLKLILHPLTLQGQLRNDLVLSEPQMIIGRVQALVRLAQLLQLRPGQIKLVAQPLKPLSLLLPLDFKGSLHLCQLIESLFVITDFLPLALKLFCGCLQLSL